MHVKARELHTLEGECGGTREMALTQVRTLIQLASRFSFAICAPSFNDAEIEQLRINAPDTVS